MLDERETKAREFGQGIAQHFNTFSPVNWKHAVAAMLNFHPTITQKIMRFFMHFVEELSKQHGDARNEAAIKLAKEIMALPEKVRSLPNI
jgi:hypothetical protein